MQTWSYVFSKCISDRSLRTGPCFLQAQVRWGASMRLSHFLRVWGSWEIYREEKQLDQSLGFSERNPEAAACPGTFTGDSCLL